MLFCLIRFNRKGKTKQCICLGMHACDKTIEESEEMIITKVRIVVTSKKEGELCSVGGLLGCWSMPFLDLVGHMEVSFIITHYTA